MDQDRRSFLKASGVVGAATITGALAASAPASAQIRTSSSASDLNQLDASELAARIARREISPVEAVEASLARLEATETALNAFAFVDADGAREAARNAEASVMRGDELGPLHGVPVSIKDLIDVADLPARYGSATLRDHIARTDAPSVQRLRQAGAIIIGKTNTSEFGYRGYTKSLVHGNTRNPWNLTRTPGGSSGGAVASIAAGVTAIGLGTDGGGSIRMPCSLTGLVGIKANFARVPVWPASATPTVAHVGPIARSVSDAALVLGIVAGPDRRDPFSLQQAIGPEPNPVTMSMLRIAFSPTLGYAKVDAPVQRVVAAAVDRLRSVFPSISFVTEVCRDPAEMLIVEFVGGLSARLGDLVDSSPDLIDPPLLAGIRKFREMSADHYTRLLRRRIEHRETLRMFFENYDLLLTPTTPCTAWDIEKALPPGHEASALWSYFTYPFNLTGQPAASIPCGLTEENLPVGLHVVAPMGNEAQLIAALRAIEQTLDSRLRTPVELTRG
jgi:aspartyl-tRNA(Asn)/glutamyl-tRNA(Gln) amidotransferase subunit A